MTRCLFFTLFLIGLTNPVHARMTGPEFGAALKRGFDTLREGHYQEAETLARQLVDASVNFPPRNQANANRLMGTVLFESARYSEAGDFLRKAQPVLEKEFGETNGASLSNLQYLGRLALTLGHYAEAEKQLARYRQLALQVSKAGDLNLTRSANSLATIYQMLGRTQEAEALYRESIKNSEGTEDRVHLYVRDRAFHLLARMLLQLNRTEEAEAMARQAVDLAERALGDSHPQTPQSLDVLGQALVIRHKEAEAETVLQRALALNEKTNGPRHTETGRTLSHLAQLAARQKRVQAAEDYYRRAIDIFRSNATSANLAQTLRGYGRFLVAQGHYREAVLPYREALDAVDTLFSQTRGLDEATRQGFISRYGNYYEEMIRLLLRLHQRNERAGHDAEALSVLSRTQSRIFTEMLRVADVSRFAGDERFAGLRRQQQGFLSELAELQQRLVLSGKSEEDGRQDLIVRQRVEQARGEIGGKLEHVRAELQKTEAALWRDYPRYMELTQPRPVSAKDLQDRLLKPGETLLAYAMLRDQIAIFLVSRDDFFIRTVRASRAHVGKLVRAVRAPEEGAAQSPSALQDLDPAILAELHGLLIKPVEANIRPGARILVVGDGPLHTLPFEMLIPTYSPQQGGRLGRGRSLASYGDLAYLGDRFQFIYLPSLSALASQRLYPKTVARFDRELVSFADPVFFRENGGPEGGMSDVTRSALALISRGAASFPRLPETADEAREIARVLGDKADLFLRGEAQERQVKKMPLKQVRYLHFATHGLLGGEFLQVKESGLSEPSMGSTGSHRTVVLAAKTPEDRAEFVEPTEEDAPQAGGARGQPALVMTLVGDLQGEDGLLTMGEVIEDLDIGAQLVVLSACNTAGETEEAGSGEGFAGLTRAFMYAGAKGLLVSHWSVESLSTQQLITALFRHMKAGKPVEQALFSARAEIRKTRGHPYFWAPFVYVGD